MLLPDLRELPAGDFVFPLGAQARVSLTNAHATLADDGGVVVYTDGATDVRREGSRLGLERLTGLLAPSAATPAWAIAGRAEQAILAWADETIRDDLCLLVLKPKDEA